MDGGSGASRRRLVAILFADVVGYSRMMAENETAALAAVRMLRRRVIGPRVARRGGRPFAALGDGFAAEFPSAVEAVACAVDVQRGLATVDPGCLQGVALRMAVNLGDAVVEPSGDVFGDAVNVAARLEALAEPGGVVISGKTHEEIRGRLAYPFAYAGEHALKNIPGPVRVFSLPAASIAALPEPAPEVDNPNGPDDAAAPRRLPRGKTLRVAGAVLATAVGVAGWSTVATHPVPAEPAAPAAPAPAPAARLSLVVLPFADFGEGAERDHLADGITEDLTTLLGDIHGAMVIGRGTAFTYKGRAVDARQVGRELGVRYAVQGSVRRLGDRVRFDTQLLHTGTGTQIWAEAFEQPRADPATLGRAAVLRIARALDYQLSAAESRRLFAERHLDQAAADLILRGRGLLSTGRSPESLAEAKRLFERALALEERSSMAHAGLATALVDTVSFGWSRAREGDLTAAEHHANRALALHPRNGWARVARSMLFEWQGRYDKALTDLNMALADYPGNVAALARRARVRLLTDRPAEALADLGEAMRISPRDWNLNTWHDFSGVACLMLGRDEDAVDHFLRARAINPNRAGHVLQLASAYQLVGRTAEARAALADYAGRRPTETIGRWRGWLDALPVPENGLFRATVERQIGAVRAIGVLPEE